MGATGSDWCQDVHWVVPSYAKVDAEMFLLPAIELLVALYADQQAQSLPFGFEMDSGFSSEGEMILSTPDAGFTCATFVAAVFASAGMPLIDCDSWRSCDAERVQADHNRRDKLIDCIAFDDAVRAHTLRQQPARAFVHAEEVAAASNMSPHPISAQRALPAGAKLLARSCWRSCSAAPQVMWGAGDARCAQEPYRWDTRMREVRCTASRRAGPQGSHRSRTSPGRRASSIASPLG